MDTPEKEMLQSPIPRVKMRKSSRRKKLFSIGSSHVPPFNAIPLTERYHSTGSDVIQIAASYP